MKGKGREAYGVLGFHVENMLWLLGVYNNAIYGNSKTLQAQRCKAQKQFYSR